MSELYLLSVWSLTFYMIEHFQEKVKTVNNFIPQVLQVNGHGTRASSLICVSLFAPPLYSHLMGNVML